MTAWQRVRHIAPPEMFSHQESILFNWGQSVFGYFLGKVLEKNSWRLLNVDDL